MTHFGTDDGGRDGSAGQPPRTEKTLQRLGRYQLLSDLGRGSMGRLYVALDPNIDRRVAIKVFAPAGHYDPEQKADLRKRFLRESRAAGSLKHTGIVAVYDAETDAASGETYIVMELVEGPSLAEVLRQRGPLPCAEAVEMIAQVADALSYAHEKELIHRDVKPGNVLIDADGRAKVTDFGIAKLAAASQTRAGSVLGSPFYMSPEQIAGDTVDSRSDLFSLGTCLYQLLTGERPFRGDSVASIGYKIVHVDPRPANSPHGSLPDSLKEALQRALAKNPDERFATGSEMAAALRAAVGEASSTPVATAGEVGGEEPAAEGMAALSPPQTERRRLWTPFLLGVLMALAVVAAVSWWTLLRDDVPSKLGAEGQLSDAPLPLRAADLGPADAADTMADPTVRQPEPAPGTVAVDDAASTDMATLLVVYKNRLRRATLSISIDGEEVVSEQMETGKNPLRRAWGRNIVVAVPVTEGEHTVEISVTGSEGKVHASDQIGGVFERGESRELRASLNPRTRKLRLAWDPAPGGSL